MDCVILSVILLNIVLCVDLFLILLVLLMCLLKWKWFLIKYFLSVFFKLVVLLVFGWVVELGVGCDEVKVFFIVIFLKNCVDCIIEF